MRSAPLVSRSSFFPLCAGYQEFLLSSKVETSGVCDNAFSWTVVDVTAFVHFLSTSSTHSGPVRE